MAAISGFELRRILQFIEVAESSDGPGPFSRESLFLLADLIPADEISYFELRMKGREPGASVAARNSAVVSHCTTGDLPIRPEVEQALALHSHQNPIGAFASGFGPADGAIRQSRVIRRRDLLRLDFYHEYFSPAGLRDTLKVWLHRSGELVACVAFERMDAEFSDHDEAVLGILQPHLAALREQAQFRSAASNIGRVSFTVREAEVLSWAARGKRNDEIAQILFISPATVRKHLDHAYEKLGVHSRTQALAQLAAIGRPEAPGAIRAS